MSRDDNQQMKQEQEEQQWYERDRILLDQIAEVSDGMIAEGKEFKSLTEAIRGKENENEHRNNHTG